MTISCSHFYFFKKVICLVFLLSFQQFLFSEPAKLKITENSFFEIVGTDLGSTQFTNELSNYVADSILSDFHQKNYVSSRRILVQLLNTESTFKDSAFYELSVSNLGFVTLNIQWNESLGLPILIEALTVSFIQSYGYSSYGELFLDKYPSKAWMLKGLSQNIYVSLRPHVARILFKETFPKYMFEGMIILEGAMELIKKLNSQGIPQAIITNKQGVNARAVSERCGFDRYINVCIGNGDNPFQKPQIEFTEAVIQAMSGDYKNIVLIGDSPTDVKTALNYKADCFAVSTGSHSQNELAEAGAKKVFSNLNEISQLWDL